MAKKWPGLKIYKPNFNDLLILHLEEGHSFASFSKKVGVTFLSLYNWLEKYPEFKSARKIGMKRNAVLAKKMGVGCLNKRATRYNEDIAKKILSSVCEGQSLISAARKFNVDHQTIYNWGKKYKLFRKAKDKAMKKKTIRLEEKD